MKALFVTAKYPYPTHTGALLYSSQILTALGEHCEEVHVLCGGTPGQQEERQDAIEFVVVRHIMRSKFAQLVSKYPFSAGKFDHGEKVELLKRYSGVDLLVIDSISSGWILDHLHLFGKPKILYVAHNLEYATRRSIAKYERHPILKAVQWYDSARVKRVEDALVSLSDVTVCICENDKAQFEKVYDGTFVSIPPVYVGPVVEGRKIDDQTDRTVCLLGSFLWSAKKNNLISFIKASYPAFDQNGIKFLVVGNIEAAFIDKVQSQWPKVAFTGPVESIQQYMKHVRIGIVPEEAGGGFKLKILDYIFNRVPLFALENAITEIDGADGRAYASCSSMRELVESIMERFDDYEYLNGLQSTAYSMNREFLDADSMANKMKSLL